MTEEIITRVNDININNLDKLSYAQSELAEKRISEISEIAYDMAHAAIALIEDGLDIYGALSLISDYINFKPNPKPGQDALTCNSDRLRALFRSISALDSAVFCELLVELMRKETGLICEESFLPSQIRDGRVAYVKNPYADEAYDVFSQQLDDPRVKYEKNFKALAMDLLDGDVSYALLPLEERGGVRLPTVTDLIYRNNLKINSVTPVFGFDGSADMRFALVSGSFTVPALNSNDDRYLEIRIDKDAGFSITDLLTVADQYGISLYRLNTLTFDIDDGTKSYYSIVFRDDGRDFTTLLVYLTLFSNDFVPVGMYKNLE